MGTPGPEYHRVETRSTGYVRRWTLPAIRKAVELSPGCGSLEACAARIGKFSRGILVQTVGDVEDSFDYEAMMEIQEAHKTRFLQMYQEIRRQDAPVLALGAGCCTHCKTCTYPNAPCRFPDQMVSSMEAYGILVLEVCRANGLQYYYGPDKMAYTSCFLL